METTKITNVVFVELNKHDIELIQYGHTLVTRSENTQVSIQFGEFVKFYKVYSKAYGYLSDGYKAEARLSLANILIQLEMLCISEGLDIDTLRDEGYEHLLDKIEEVEAKGGKMI